ncbi:MAG: DUF6491 family protein [Porticoccaceae bacterium]|jgi:hypothetical protein
MRSFHLSSAAIALIAVLAGTSVFAEDDSADKKCIPLNQINNIQVLDKQHILFRMQGREHFLNTLPNSCGSLHRNKPIMYKTSLSQLCSLDIISVLESYGGGYYPGASCGLGNFSPISDEEIKALKAELKNRN